MDSTPPGDDHIHAVDDHLFRSRGDGHQAGGALAVHRHAGNAHRQAGAQGGRAADRVLHALLQGGAHDHVLDFGRIDLRALDGGLDRVARERRGGCGVEGAAIGLADRRTGGGNDDGITHEGSLVIRVIGSGSAVRHRPVAEGWEGGRLREAGRHCGGSGSVRHQVRLPCGFP